MKKLSKINKGTNNSFGAIFMTTIMVISMFAQFITILPAVAAANGIGTVTYLNIGGFVSQPLQGVITANQSKDITLRLYNDATDGSCIDEIIISFPATWQGSINTSTSTATNFGNVILTNEIDDGTYSGLLNNTLSLRIQPDYASNGVPLCPIGTTEITLRGLIAPLNPEVSQIMIMTSDMTHNEPSTSYVRQPISILPLIQVSLTEYPVVRYLDFLSVTAGPSPAEYSILTQAKGGWGRLNDLYVNASANLLVDVYVDRASAGLQTGAAGDFLIANDVFLVPGVNTISMDYTVDGRPINVVGEMADGFIKDAEQTGVARNFYIDIVSGSGTLQVVGHTDEDADEAVDPTYLGTEYTNPPKEGTVINVENAMLRKILVQLVRVVDGRELDVLSNNIPIHYTTTLSTFVDASPRLTDTSGQVEIRLNPGTVTGNALVNICYPDIACTDEDIAISPGAPVRCAITKGLNTSVEAGSLEIIEATIYDQYGNIISNTPSAPLVTFDMRGTAPALDADLDDDIYPPFTGDGDQFEQEIAQYGIADVSLRTSATIGPHVVNVTAGNLFCGQTTIMGTIGQADAVECYATGLADSEITADQCFNVTMHVVDENGNALPNWESIVEFNLQDTNKYIQSTDLREEVMVNSQKVKGKLNNNNPAYATITVCGCDDLGTLMFECKSDTLLDDNQTLDVRNSNASCLDVSAYGRDGVCDDTMDLQASVLDTCGNPLVDQECSSGGWATSCTLLQASCGLLSTNKTSINLGNTGVSPFVGFDISECGCGDVNVLVSQAAGCCNQIIGALPQCDPLVINKVGPATHMTMSVQPEASNQENFFVSERTLVDLGLYDSCNQTAVCDDGLVNVTLTGEDCVDTSIQVNNPYTATEMTNCGVLNQPVHKVVVQNCANATKANGGSDWTDVPEESDIVVDKIAFEYNGPTTNVTVCIYEETEATVGFQVGEDLLWKCVDLNTIPTLSAPVVLTSTAVDLGTAANFIMLGKAGITTTGTTTIVGDIGVSPAAASYITGFGLTMDTSNQFATSSIVNGKVYAADYTPPTPAVMTTAISDMEAAYTDLAGRAPTQPVDVYAGNLGGQTLVPGVYKWTTGVTIPTDVTLSGGANDVWIFQVAGNLDISSATSVILSGGAQAKNIFWVVAGQTTLGTTSVFNGNILDQTAIVLDNGATLNGRAFAQTIVTLDANTVSLTAASTDVDGQNGAWDATHDLNTLRDGVGDVYLIELDDRISKYNGLNEYDNQRLGGAIVQPGDTKDFYIVLSSTVGTMGQCGLYNAEYLYFEDYNSPDFIEWAYSGHVIDTMANSEEYTRRNDDYTGSDPYPNTQADTRTYGFGDTILHDLLFINGQAWFVFRDLVSEVVNIHIDGLFNVTVTDNGYPVILADQAAVNFLTQPATQVVARNHGDLSGSSFICNDVGFEPTILYDPDHPENGDTINNERYCRPAMACSDEGYDVNLQVTDGFQNQIGLANTEVQLHSCMLFPHYVYLDDTAFPWLQRNVTIDLWDRMNLHDVSVDPYDACFDEAEFRAELVEILNEELGDHSAMASAFVESSEFVNFLHSIVADKDATFEAVSGYPLTFDSVGHQVVTTDANGQARVRVVSNDSSMFGIKSFDTSYRVFFVPHALDADYFDVAFAPGVPAAWNVMTLPENGVPADGEQEARVFIRKLDACGNAVEVDEQVTVSITSPSGRAIISKDFSGSNNYDNEISGYADSCMLFPWFEDCTLEVLNDVIEDAIVTVEDQYCLPGGQAPSCGGFPGCAMYGNVFDCMLNECIWDVGETCQTPDNATIHFVGAPIKLAITEIKHSDLLPADGFLNPNNDPSNNELYWPIDGCNPDQCRECDLYSNKEICFADCKRYGGSGGWVTVNVQDKFGNRVSGYLGDGLAGDPGDVNGNPDNVYEKVCVALSDPRAFIDDYTFGFMGLDQVTTGAESPRIYCGDLAFGAASFHVVYAALSGPAGSPYGPNQPMDPRQTADVKVTVFDACDREVFEDWGDSGWLESNWDDLCQGQEYNENNLPDSETASRLDPAYGQLDFVAPADRWNIDVDKTTVAADGMDYAIITINPENEYFDVRATMEATVQSDLVGSRLESEAITDACYVEGIVDPLNPTSILVNTEDCSGGKAQIKLSSTKAGVTRITVTGNNYGCLVYQTDVPGVDFAVPTCLEYGIIPMAPKTIEVEFKQAFQNSVELQSGWNFFSVPVELAPSGDQWSELGLNTQCSASAMWNDATQTWTSPIPAGTVLQPLEGYWCKSNVEATISVTPRNLSGGVYLPPMKTIYPGWNDVGVASYVELKIEHALISIDNAYSLIVTWIEGTQKYEAYANTGEAGGGDAQGTTGTGDMEVGEGYFLWADTSANLVGQSR